MFLYDNWYPVALAEDVSTEAVIACNVMDLRIALFRTASGNLGALKDRCSLCDRSLCENADCVGCVLQCRCNGAEFNRIGACVRVPGMAHTPPGDYAVRAYPVVERAGTVWLWPGSVAKADARAIPPSADGYVPSSRRALPERSANLVAASNSETESRTAPGGSSMTANG